jgi:hypothetical protein
VQKIKLAQTSESMCSDTAALLLPFVKEVFSYRYKTEPNYEKLKFHLIGVLLKYEITPDLRFDWSKFST